MIIAFQYTLKKYNKRGKMLTFDAEKHEYKFDGKVIPSVTQIIKEAGLINLDFVDKDLLAEKADLGTKIHVTTQLYDKGSLDVDSLHPILKKYLDNWIKFKKDYGFQVEEIETMYYHSKYSFAGTLDRIGVIGKDKVLLDIKSGGKYDSHRIQTAAYKLLYDFEKPKKEIIKKRFIVYLSGNDTVSYKVEENTRLNDDKIFLASLTIYNYKKGLI